MTRYEHLPIYKEAFDLALHVEKTARRGRRQVYPSSRSRPWIRPQSERFLVTRPPRLARTIAAMRKSIFPTFNHLLLNGDHRDRDPGGPACVATPGPTTADLTRLHCSRRRGPMHPFEPGAAWAPDAWSPADRAAW
jgi:hypothetical protein